MMMRKVQPRISADLRHMIMRVIKISKYSITDATLTSISSSSVMVFFEAFSPESFVECPND